MLRFHDLGFHGTPAAHVPSILEDGLKHPRGIWHMRISRHLVSPVSIESAIKEMMPILVTYPDLTSKRIAARPQVSVNVAKKLPLPIEIIIFDATKAIENEQEPKVTFDRSEMWVAKTVPPSAIIGHVSFSSSDLKDRLREWRENAKIEEKKITKHDWVSKRISEIIYSSLNLEGLARKLLGNVTLLAR